MNGELKYGGVALGVEAALPHLRLRRRPALAFSRIRRTLTCLYAALKRWA